MEETPLYAIILNGTYGKDLTLKYLNYFLIEAGLKVMYVKLSSSDIIENIYIDTQKVTANKNSKVITSDDDVLLIEELYIKHKCDVIISKSGKLNQYYSILVSGFTKLDPLYVHDFDSDTLIRKGIPLVTSVQTSEIMEKIYNTCNRLGVPAFVSEHYHLSYLKINTGLGLDYSYKSYALALRLVFIFLNIYNKGDPKVIDFTNYNRIKINGYKFYDYTLPRTEILPSITNLNFGKYYGKELIKDNVKYYVNLSNNVLSSLSIAKWFDQPIEAKTVNFCIYYKMPSNNLIPSLLPLCGIDFETMYIIDYTEFGNSFENLEKIFFDNFMIESYDSDWAETTYNCVSSIISNEKYKSVRKNYGKLCTFNLVVDKMKYIIQWIDKYSSVNKDINLRVLVTGDKKMINEFYNLKRQNELLL